MPPYSKANSHHQSSRISITTSSSTEVPVHRRQRNSINYRSTHYRNNDNNLTNYQNSSTFNFNTRSDDPFNNPFFNNLDPFEHMRQTMSAHHQFINQQFESMGFPNLHFPFEFGMDFHQNPNFGFGHGFPFMGPSNFFDRRFGIDNMFGSGMPGFNTHFSFSSNFGNSHGHSTFETYNFSNEQEANNNLRGNEYYNNNDFKKWKKTLRKERKLYFETWQRINEEPNAFQPRHFKDVPWPLPKGLVSELRNFDLKNIDLNELITVDIVKEFLGLEELIEMETKEDQRNLVKRLIKTELLRYHPDRFLSLGWVDNDKELGLKGDEANLAKLVVNRLADVLQTLWKQI